MLQLFDNRFFLLHGMKFFCYHRLSYSDIFSIKRCLCHSTIQEISLFVFIKLIRMFPNKKKSEKNYDICEFIGRHFKNLKKKTKTKRVGRGRRLRSRFAIPPRESDCFWCIGSAINAVIYLHWLLFIRVESDYLLINNFSKHPFSIKLAQNSE